MCLRPCNKRKLVAELLPIPCCSIAARFDKPFCKNVSHKTMIVELVLIFTPNECARYLMLSPHRMTQASNVSQTWDGQRQFHHEHRLRQSSKSFCFELLRILDRYCDSIPTSHLKGRIKAEEMSCRPPFRTANLTPSTTYGLVYPRTSNLS